MHHSHTFDRTDPCVGITAMLYIISFSRMATAGGLPTGTTEAEIERQFTKYGTLSSVWVARKPAGFGERSE